MGKYTYVRKKTYPYSRRKTPPQQRFWPKVDKGGDFWMDFPCWNWTGQVDRNGYGWFTPTKGDNPQCAHRVAYEWLVGPIPEGLQVDHLCRNRRCVQPRHLEAVPGRINILRGFSPAALHARKTHCPQGHPYSGDNLYTTVAGNRKCKECRREACRRWYAKHTAHIGT